MTGRTGQNTRLLLVKHAYPVMVPDIPARDWLLSADGRQQSVTLADQLRPYDPNIVIASREPKASETGRIIAGHLHLPFSEADNLHEHDRTQEPYTDNQTFKAKIRAFFDQPDQRVYGSETANVAHDRFARALASIRQHQNGKNIVIVSHGTVISLYAARLLQIDPYLLWESLMLPSMLVLEGNKFIAHWNTTLES